MKKFLFLLIFFLVFKTVAALTITEIMYNPEGNDSGREWIEVFNNSSQTIEILSGKNGWRINDGKNHFFEENLTVGPQEIFVIVQDKNLFLKDYPNFNNKLVTANFSLKNENGQIQIIDNQKNILTQIFYQSSCGGNGNGFSIIFENNTCKENKIKGGTPGSLEVYEEKASENQSSLNENNQLSSTLSTKKNNQSITAQSSTITQTQVPSKETNNELIPTSSNNTSNTPISTYISTSAQNFTTTTTTFLIISEFYPNPPGNDNGQEFVELYNPAKEIIDLNNFVLEIGKKKIKLSGKIEPEEYFVITNKDYDFSIRNKGEKLTLYFKQDKVFSINYQGQAPEGKSYSRFEDGWQFTEPTPGKENLKPKQEVVNFSQVNSDLITSSSEIITTTNLAAISSGLNLNHSVYLIISLLVIIFLVFLVWFKL